jgi:ABC-type transport system involved in multi-copper enzyme maturation permease subunit
VLVAASIVVAFTTRAGIIARAATKEAVRQPVFPLLIVIAIAILVVNTFLPFFSLGDDIKMLKDCGLATILISGLLLAVWTASTSIADEIEGKTAMTLLSKPINRRQFVIGKYLGILHAVLLMLIPVVLMFLLLIYYKVGYDARESSAEIPPWFQWKALAGGLQLPLPTGTRLEAVVQIIPGLALIFLETSVLAAVSVAISTRLPMVVNMVTCFAIFVIGHLTPVLVRTTLEGLEFVKFMAQLIATVLPSLEIFNTNAAVATGTIIPPAYLGYSALYSAAYCTAAILLAFILFEDRDLA